MSVKKSILVIPLKLFSINEYAKPNTKGIEINIANTKNKIFSCFKKIWDFEIKTNNIITTTTGIEDGLEANSKKIIIKSSE